jgi:hypothetical protein
MAETNLYFPPAMSIPADYDSEYPTRATERLSIVLLENIRQMSQDGHIIDDGRPTEDDRNLYEGLAAEVESYASSVTSGLDLPVPLPTVNLPTGLDPASIAVWVAQMAVKWLINVGINWILNGSGGGGGGLTEEQGDAIIENLEGIMWAMEDMTAIHDRISLFLGPEEGEGIDGENGLYELLQKALIEDFNVPNEAARRGLAFFTKLNARYPLTLRVNAQHGNDWSFEAEDEAP